MTIKPVLSGIVRSILSGVIDGDNGGSLNPSFIASRTSGFAPLAVHFDCTASTSTATARPWQDITCAFDYGDAGSGNYTYAAVSNSPKNRNVGGLIGGHVYETAGIYTAQCWLYDGYRVSLVQNTITVASQDSTFATTNTICCSTSGNFTGAPSGSSNQTVADLAAALAFVATGKRVLLARVDAWTLTATYTNTTAVTDAVLGSYGAGSRAAITKNAGSFTLYKLNNINSARVVFQDLAITGASSTLSATFTLSTALSNDSITLHNITDTLSSGLIALEGTSVSNGLCIHKCQVSALKGGAGNVGIYVSGNKMMILDTLVDDATAIEHCIRLPYSSKGFYYGNTAQFPAATKHCFTLRGQLWDTSEFVGIPINTYSEYNVVANSKFRSDVQEPFTIRSTNFPRDERFRRNCVEGNFTEATGTTTVTGMAFYGVELIIRNNVNITTANFAGGIVLSNGIVQTISDIFVVNNTAYTVSAVSEFIGVRTASATGNFTAYNNLAVGLNCTSSSTKSTYTAGATMTSVGNNSDASVRTVNPLFNGALTAIEGFTLQAGSPYVSFATSVDTNSTFQDAVGYNRVPLRDTGALNNVNKNTTYWSLHAG